MNKIKIAFFFLFAFLCQFPKIGAQTTDSIYALYLKDPTKVPPRVKYTSDKFNAIKLRVFDMMDGHLPIVWEHRFNNWLGVDLAPGLILPFTINDYINSNVLDDLSFSVIDNSGLSIGTTKMNTSFVNHHLGFSAFVQPKVYAGDIVIGERSPTRSTQTYPWLSCGPFYSFKNYSSVMINEVGFAFDFITYSSSEHFTSQWGVSVSYLQQSPKHNISEVRYNGVQSPELSMFGIPNVNILRITLRYQLGYIFANKIKPYK